MIRTVPVDPASLRLIALAVEPKTDFETKSQKTTPTGIPVWTVSAYSLAEADSLRVSIAAATAPEVSPGQPIDFVELRAGAYVSGGRAAFYWNAEGIE